MPSASISIPTIIPAPPVKRAESLNHTIILRGKQNLMGGKVRQSSGLGRDSRFWTTSRTAGISGPMFKQTAHIAINEMAPIICQLRELPIWFTMKARQPSPAMEIPAPTPEKTQP